jgi:hypothetical protein
MDLLVSRNGLASSARCACVIYRGEANEFSWNKMAVADISQLPQKSNYQAKCRFGRQLYRWNSKNRHWLLWGSALARSCGCYAGRGAPAINRW